MRQQNLVRLSMIIDENSINGALVECGVLDGGTAALMAYTTKETSRSIHLFDAWEGLPESTEEDGIAGKKWVGEVVGSPKRVAEIMTKLSISSERIFIHRGWFEDTFPNVTITEIALLHIDCDFYSPTTLCLSRWYSHISPGGYIQFDDYSEFQGCKQAVDEFLNIHPEIELQVFGTIGQGEAYFIQKPLVN
jgi:O-methyltransferase